MNNKLLKIAVLSVHSSPLDQPGIGDTGGMSIYIRELTREMVKLGHQVDVYTRVQNKVSPTVTELVPGVRLIHIHAGQPAYIDKMLIYSHVPDFACKVESFRREHYLHYDLLFCHYWLSGIAGWYLQTWWQVPQVMMFHTLGAIKNAIGIGEDEPDLRIDEEKQIAQYCHRIIASTEKEKKVLNRYYSVPFEKISVIPCGVNLELFQPRDSSLARRKIELGNGIILLFVGRIERLKGIDKLIQTMPLISDLHPQLVIVGENGNRPGEIDHLKSLTTQLGVADSIIFTGLIEYEKLTDYYNAADICVFPSYYESFGLVPLEALACGTPVVATDVGNLRNIIISGKTGYVLSDNQPLLMADKIRELVTRRDFNKSDIRSSVAAYSWQNIAGDLCNLFGSIIG
jgi:D-inositol-3-phosphate glycosyltransferase